MKRLKRAARMMCDKTQELRATVANPRRLKPNKKTTNTPHAHQSVDLHAKVCLFGCTADKALQMHAAIFRHPRPAYGPLFFFSPFSLAAINSCRLSIPTCSGWSTVWEQRHVGVIRHSKPTILQSATARWALRVLSVLSLRCASR